ncbi:MAG: EamA family transporter [Lachnospiraceae bacterium]|nr:EamA family transporter [Lachnospiraceae bacterium]
MLYGLIGGFFWACDGILLTRVFGTGSTLQTGSLQKEVLTAGLHDTFSASTVLLFFLLRRIKGALDSVFFSPGDRAGKRTRPSLTVTASENMPAKSLSPLQISPRRAALYFIIASILGGPVGTGSYLAAISLTGAGYAAAVSAMYPAAGAAVAALTGRESIQPDRFPGILLCVGGAVLISRTPQIQTLHPAGFGLAALAALCWGLEGVICSAGLSETSFAFDTGLLLRQMTSCCIYLLFIFPLAGIYSMPVRQVQGGGQLWSGGFPEQILFIAMAGTAGAVSYLCYYKAIEKIGPSSAMAANVTYTVWAVLLEVLATGNLPSPPVMVCSLFIFAGAVMAAGSCRRQL